MNTDLAIVLLLLAAAIVMFAINKPRMDAVALIMLTALPFTGVITHGRGAGWLQRSEHRPDRSAVRDRRWPGADGRRPDGSATGSLAKAGSSETRLLVLLMVAVAGSAPSMSSTGVIAIFIPVALRIAQNTGLAPSRLMMPLSVAALISGMMTLVATAPNLVVNSELVRHGADGFHFFSFTPFGVPVLILGIVYMLFTRRWLASERQKEAKAPTPEPRRLDREIQARGPRIPAPRHANGRRSWARP